MSVINTQDINESFLFIRQMLSDAFKVESFYFSYPYHNLQDIDRGFREMAWSDFTNEGGSWNSDSGSFAGQYRLFIVRSSFGFYNLIAFVSLDKHPDFISVGPFRAQEISDSFFRENIQSGAISRERLSVMRQFYESFPFADIHSLTTMFVHLLGAFIPEFCAVVPEEISYSESTHTPAIYTEQAVPFYTAAAEDFIRHIQLLLDAVSSGHSAAAYEEMQAVLTLLNISTQSTVSKLRTELLEMNALFFGRLLTAQLSAFPVCNLYYTFQLKITKESQSTRLFKLFHEMVRKYCLLLRNHTDSDCSLLVRKTKDYVMQHLSEELSLSVIAAVFQKNAAYLSAQFKKETSQTLTGYIQQERIRAAIRFFNEGIYSVTEVAAAVGIPDCCRFSKLFKKHTGVSPREYRKMLGM